MARRQTKRRVFALVAVLLGLGTVAVGYELLIQYTQRGMLARAVEKYVAAAADADFLIAAVGDSHVKGKEAPPGFDYPTQLELRLRTLRPQSKIRVANIGEAGYNTSQAVDRLGNVIEKTGRYPDLVIFTAGYNNIWNFQKAWFIPEDIQGRQLDQQLRYLLAKSANYRLGVITLERMRQLLDENQGYRGHNTAVFNEDDPNEVKFLSSWIKRDVEGLATSLGDQGTRVLLVTYWHPYRWVDEAFEALAETDNVDVADVRGLGFDGLLDGQLADAFIAPGSHPNKYGYARVAELVAKAMDEDGLLPPEKPGNP